MSSAGVWEIALRARGGLFSNASEAAVAKVHECGVVDPAGSRSRALLLSAAIDAISDQFI